MKPIYGRTAAALGLTFAVAACIPSPDSTPAPERAEAPTVTPTSASMPSSTPTVTSPSNENWLDAPRTAGEWRYRLMGGGSAALFGQSENEPRFGISCDMRTKEIELVFNAVPNVAHQNRPGADTIIIRTETLDRSLAVQPLFQGFGVGASLRAGDPLLDAIALTRGRFAVELAGQPTLYLPAWAEVTRVIEDCR